MKLHSPGSRLRFVGPCAFLLGACAGHHPSVTVAAAKPSSSARPPASAVGSAEPPSPPPRPFEPSTFTVFKSPKPDVEDWVVGVERRSDMVRLVLERPFSYGAPITVWGPIDPSGAFTAKDAPGPEQLTVKGSVGGAKLVASFVGGSEEIALRKGTPSFSPDGTFDATYEGLVNDQRRTRVRWSQNRFVVTASYQYIGEPPRELLGTVAKDTGLFDMKETDGKGVVTGQWEGALFGASDAMGRWTSADRTVSLPFTLDSASAPYPEAVTLANGARLAPAERYQRRGSTCVDSTVYAKPSGIAPAAETAVNGALATLFGVATFKAPSCVTPSMATVMWNDTNYRVTGSGDAWVGIEERAYGYMGGVHGIGSSSCFIVTADGRLKSLARELPPAARKRLGPLVRAALLKQASASVPHVLKLQDVGFIDDTVVIDEGRSLCAVRGAKDRNASLEVVFEDEADGRFVVFDPRARLSAEVVRPLFPPGSVGAMVFAD